MYWNKKVKLVKYELDELNSNIRCIEMESAKMDRMVELIVE